MTITCPDCQAPLEPLNGEAHCESCNTDLALGGLERLGGLRHHRRTARLAAALASVQATAVVVIAAAAKITLLKINSAATLEALFLALSVAGVGRGSRRSLLPKAACGTARTGAASRTRRAAGAAGAARTGTAGTGRPASAVSGRIAAGAAVASAGGAGILPERQSDHAE